MWLNTIIAQLLFHGRARLATVAYSLSLFDLLSLVSRLLSRLRAKGSLTSSSLQVEPKLGLQEPFGRDGRNWQVALTRITVLQRLHHHDALPEPLSGCQAAQEMNELRGAWRQHSHREKALHLNPIRLLVLADLRAWNIPGSSIFPHP